MKKRDYVWNCDLLFKNLMIRNRQLTLVSVQKVNDLMTHGERLKIKKKRKFKNCILVWKPTKKQKGFSGGVRGRAPRRILKNEKMCKQQLPATTLLLLFLSLSVFLLLCLPCLSFSFNFTFPFLSIFFPSQGPASPHFPTSSLKAAHCNPEQETPFFKNSFRSAQVSNGNHETLTSWNTNVYGMMMAVPLVPCFHFCSGKSQQHNFAGKFF